MGGVGNGKMERMKQEQVFITEKHHGYKTTQKVCYTWSYTHLTHMRLQQGSNDTIVYKQLNSLLKIYNSKVEFRTIWLLEEP